MYPQSIVDEIKERLSIVAIVGEYLPLKRAGRNFKGHCPFHKEKTPSFMVSDEKQIYHCFGCGAGGDLLHFVMKQEGWSFPEAIKALAPRAGVTLPKATGPAASSVSASANEEAQKDRHRRMLLRVNQLAAEYYHGVLTDPVKGKIGCNYLISRGFKDSPFWTQHFLGFAEDGWEGLTRYLAERKVPMELPVALGLIRPRKEGTGYFDFFRHRLIFPIIGQRGEITGFGARMVPRPDGAPDIEVAKYLNSSDSLVYQKGRTVYGLAVAAAAIRQNDRLLIVEGYLDVLACQQAGIGEVVAPLGTALTDGHLRLLKRFTRNIWVVFDGDAAGRQAARRSLPLFVEEGLVPRVVILPEGDDPDSVVRQQGAATLLGLLPGAPTLFEWVIDETVAECGLDTAGKRQAVDDLRPFFARLSNAVEEAAYVGRLAQRMGLEEAVVRRGLKERQSARRQFAVGVAKPATDNAPLPFGAERELLAFILQMPKAMPLVAHRVQPTEFLNAITRAIAECCWNTYEERGELHIGHAVEAASSSEMGAIMTGLAFVEGKYDDPAAWNRLADELVAAIRRPQWNGRLQELNRAIATAERDGRGDDVRLLMTQKRQLLQEERTHLWNANR